MIKPGHIHNAYTITNNKIFLFFLLNGRLLWVNVIKYTIKISMTHMSSILKGMVNLLQDHCSFHLAIPAISYGLRGYKLHVMKQYVCVGFIYPRHR